VNGAVITIDAAAGVVVVQQNGGTRRLRLDEPEAFRLISDAWLYAGWIAKHVYSFSWLGRPVIQLPEDLLRIQEVLFTVRPDVIIETGVAHGGSLIFYASLCRLLGKGRVIGIDVDIRPDNRAAIEDHPLADLVTLIEGSSIEPSVVARAQSLLSPDEIVLVALDSRHTKAHVLAELRAYAPLVSLGSYVVVMDGVMERLAGAPRSAADWGWNNPRQAALEFARTDTRFEIAAPPFLFNEGAVSAPVTYWPDGYLRRVR
jgi:cephalosporin hydroxylase